jgi:hypothetical protein
MTTCRIRNGRARKARGYRRRGIARATREGIADGRNQRDAEQNQAWQQAPRKQIGLDRSQKLGHGFTFTTAGVAAEPLDVLPEALCDWAPAGPEALAPPSAEAPAGST